MAQKLGEILYKAGSAAGQAQEPSPKAGAAPKQDQNGDEPVDADFEVKR